MTNEEMIKWAKLEDASDLIWHARRENLDALIWIAQTHARTEVWKQVAAIARQQADASAISSYPSLRKQNG